MYLRVGGIVGLALEWDSMHIGTISRIRVRMHGGIVIYPKALNLHEGVVEHADVQVDGVWYSADVVVQGVEQTLAEVLAV